MRIEKEGGQVRFLTAGESHGQKLVGIIEGFPAGIKIAKSQVDAALMKRQQGPGRGGRMAIESDEAFFISGIRGGFSTGAPIALEIRNRDWENWSEVMAWGEDADLQSRKVTAPRPGHADLNGALKYRTEIRNILERASARETAMRVAVGNIARQGLSALGVEIRGHVLAVGGVHATHTGYTEYTEHEEYSKSAEYKINTNCPEHDDIGYWKNVENSVWSVGDPETEKKIEARLQEAVRQGESLGGLLEVQVHNLPAGLGSHVQWDRKLDGRLAQAVLSVQAIKGVSFGMGFAAGDLPGSLVHDPIVYRQGSGFNRLSNNAGGIEGGMSNGEPVVLQTVMKPIPTLLSPLDTADIETKEPVKAAAERSDTCAVPAALVVLEHVVAWVIAEAVLEKFPADSFQELQVAWEAYRAYLKS